MAHEAAIPADLPWDGRQIRVSVTSAAERKVSFSVTHVKAAAPLPAWQRVQFIRQSQDWRGARSSDWLVPMGTSFVGKKADDIKALVSSREYLELAQPILLEDQQRVMMDPAGTYWIVGPKGKRDPAKVQIVLS